MGATRRPISHLRHITPFLVLIYSCTLIISSVGAWHTSGSRYLQIRRPVLRGGLHVHRTDPDLIAAHQRVVRLPLDMVNEELQHRLSVNNTVDLVQIEGYVTAKRGFGPSFCFLDLSEKNQSVAAQAMLKRQDYLFSDKFDAIMSGMVPGVRISLTGRVAPSRNPGEALIKAHTIRIVGMPRNPQHVRILLQLTADGQLDMQEIAEAAIMNPKELEHGIKAERGAQSDKPFYELAKQLVASLPEDDRYPDLSSDKYAYSLPVAPPDVRIAPLFQFKSRAMLNANESISVERAHALLSSSAEASIALTGWIQNRRRFRDSIAVLEVVDRYKSVTEKDSPESYEEFWKGRIKCVSHPDVTTFGNRSKLYAQLMAPGSHVLLQGCLVADEQSLPILWITNARLLRASWRPTVLNCLIEATRNNDFDASEAAHAVRIPEMELYELLEKDLTERQWKAAEISTELQDGESRMAIVSNDELSVLDHFEHIRDRYRITPIDITMETESSTEGSRRARKKEPQLEWMTRQVQDAVHSHPDFGKRPLKILDVGGGNGHLANTLASSLGEDEVEIQVVDIALGAVKNGAMRSKRRTLKVKYTVGDASVADFRGQVDLVVALHACGALADVALGHAIANKAGFVICPCCFRSNPHLRIIPPNRKALEPNNRLISAEDWLGVDVKRYASLKLLAEVQGDTSFASCAIHSICALRAAACESHTTIPIHVAIRTFPIAFSTRNFCLVGSFLQ